LLTFWKTNTTIELMRILFHILLVLWNVALLAGLIVLLTSGLGWITKLLALFFVPMVVMTGFGAWRNLLKKSDQ